VARADFSIADVEGGVMAGQIGPDTYGVSGRAGLRDVFGPGTVGRKEAYIALGVAAFMLIYWRAAKGY
jgi:hypothetical protein